MVRGKQHTPTKSNEKTSKKRTDYRQYAIGSRTFMISTKLLNVIGNLQKSTDLCVPRLSFSRLIREIFQYLAPNSDLRIQAIALVALQEAAEIFLTQLFNDANICAMHAKRATIRPSDLKLVLTLRGVDNPGLPRD